MKILRILVIVSALALTGCSKPAPGWVERNEPTTDAERRAVAEHVEKILASTPKSLSGHDQDWDDAIKEAHRQARLSLCRTTFWEWQNEGWGTGHFTGRWKYADDPK